MPFDLEKFFVPSLRHGLKFFDPSAHESLEAFFSRLVLGRWEPVNAPSLFAEYFVIMPNCLNRGPICVICAICSPWVSLPLVPWVHLWRWRVTSKWFLKLAIFTPVIVFEAIISDYIQVSTRTIRRVVKSCCLFARSDQSSRPIWARLESCLLWTIINAQFILSSISKYDVTVPTRAISRVGSILWVECSCKCIFFMQLHPKWCHCSLL